eukprot:scaffold122319_cov14-Tisochrysis_lutea.AAC.1
MHDSCQGFYEAGPGCKQANAVGVTSLPVKTTADGCIQVLPGAPCAALAFPSATASSCQCAMLPFFSSISPKLIRVRKPSNVHGLHPPFAAGYHEGPARSAGAPAPN